MTDGLDPIHTVEKILSQPLLPFSGLKVSVTLLMYSPGLQVDHMTFLS